ncbi:MAG: hypothetical protein SF028_15520 [Candidatus Sumerlaeia bacterium]|nr:hypothetical protein [Candidatus Sumerlaeia bacterium]
MTRKSPAEPRPCIEFMEAWLKLRMMLFHDLGSVPVEEYLSDDPEECLQLLSVCSRSIRRLSWVIDALPSEKRLVELKRTGSRVKRRPRSA